MKGRGSLWDSELVSGVAFHPRKCRAKTTWSAAAGGWIDNVVNAGDGTPIAYRLYVAPPRSGLTGASEPTQSLPVLVYFHANAELCTDMASDIGLFYECGFRAVLCPEFRGFGWSGGQASLTSLCSDAEAVFEAAPRLLADAGMTEAAAVPKVLCGRSLGAACAVHLAAKFGPDHVAGLLLESGCMSLMDLPMVRQMSAMMPGMLQALSRSPEPLGTLGKMRQVTVPTLILHGDQDEMIPVQQAVAAHQACASREKKLVRLRRCGHNDIRVSANSEFRTELRLIADIASGAEPPEALLREPPPAVGFFGMLASGLRCFPGMRRCLAPDEAPQVIEVEDQVDEKSAEQSSGVLG